MKPASPKVFPGMTAFPRTVYSISVSVGGLALFLVFGSWLLLSYPIGSALQGYFLGIDHSRKFGISLPVGNETLVLHYNPDASQDGINKKPSSESGNTNGSTRNPHSTNSSYVLEDKEGATSTPVSKLPSDTTGEKEPINSTISANISEAKGHLRSSDTGSSVSTWASSSSSLETSPPLSYLSNNSGKVHSGSCNLYHGKWFYDSSGPLYTNNTCPVLTQTQNCQGNGRPDKDYENWRWKPSQCDLPRFDAKKFLELMRGKTLVFIGDSVARNQMESMLCILWQVEVPRNRGNRKMQRWYFKSTSFTIIRIWSSWLVHQTSEPFDFAPEGVVKIHLDIPDESFMDLLPSFDVVVLSSGHWFAKQSVYILNNEIVGGQLWWPHKSRPMKVNNVEAFGISIETILTAMATHPNYTGLTIVRSYSPDHYEGGAWNTGGSCTGKVRPAKELVSNGFTDIMYAKQVKGFNCAIEKVTGRSKLRLMDITEVFGYRHDGHPGPYRSPDPNKKTQRGPHGEPPPQDCLHWCMPGPVDTWNELVLEIIRREFEGNHSVPA